MFGLIGAGFGVTFAVESQSQVNFPGVVFKPIAEMNAYVDVRLAWLPDAEDALVGRFISFMRDAARNTIRANGLRRVSE